MDFYKPLLDCTLFREGKTYDTSALLPWQRKHNAYAFPLDCLNSGEFTSKEVYDVVFHEVGLDNPSDESCFASEREADRVTIGKRLSVREMVEVSVQMVKPMPDTQREYDCAVNKDASSIAHCAGCYAVAVNTAYRAASFTTGGSAISANVRNYTIAQTIGAGSIASHTGDCAIASSSGVESASCTTGNFSLAQTAGIRSIAMSVGERGAAEAQGAESIAVALGYASQARAALGSWLVLSEEVRGVITDVQCVRVDGDDILPNVWYILRRGKIVKTTTTEE